ncbi:MAG TPA: undecaprenyl-phosphate glucose phosphotransferase [Myxococcales bacterium]|jgi:Undecaprenyl-phosphate glucose phosphotransferase|nr:undecaprenyl-phosphate glucose phosphotransferase [Myxococcales bacterium]
MFKRHHQLFTALRVALDLAIVAVAFAGAYSIRFGSPVKFPYNELPPREETLFVGAVALLLWPLSLRAVGLYRPQRQKSPFDEVFAVFKATLLASLLLVAATYFLRGRYSRGALLIFEGLAFVGVGLVRALFKEALQILRRRGYNLRYILVLGTGRLARHVLEAVDQHRELGYRPVGCLSVSRKRVGRSVAGVQVIGTLRDLGEVIVARGVDQVLVALPGKLAHHVPAVMEVLADTTVDVKLVPDALQYATLFGGLEEFGGLPVVSLQSSGVLGFNAILKRAFDLVFSLLFVLLLSPVLLLIALAVKLSSRGPALFAQERVGLDGRAFRMLKFRTMRTDAEAAGPQFAQSADPRATPLGALLRRLSLDELPQLLNVLRGDMSLVGPRPERPVFIARFRRRIPRYQLRHMVKAGMTGWAQIHGLRGNTSIAKRVEYDLYYIEHWSLLLDFKILARTVAFGFLSRNAY